jgi:ADP-ribosyl-[dinitrogen reductase] hydrolase
MKLIPEQLDRARGVLLGTAAGDALGAGYEFAPVAPDLVPAMIGGGLGDFAPGEWTDDTAQAVAIAQVAATGADLRTDAALTAVARRFADWFADDPADVGIHTRAVLASAGRTPTADVMRAAAQAVHDRSGRSAGNGSLMRTGPVVLAHLDDPVALVDAALAVGALTHPEDIAQQGCAVWSLLVRHAVLTGDLPTFDDVAPWVPDLDRWRDVLAAAEAMSPQDLATNGWVVGAMQAAWWAILSTVPAQSSPESDHLSDGLTAAIRLGNDTDTVAAIAGALLGAVHGASAVRSGWRTALHGWPGLDADDLEQLTDRTVGA